MEKPIDRKFEYGLLKKARLLISCFRLYLIELHSARMEHGDVLLEDNG